MASGSFGSADKTDAGLSFQKQLQKSHPEYVFPGELQLCGCQRALL